MTTNKAQRSSSPDADKAAATDQAAGNAPVDPSSAQAASFPPALPPPRSHPACDPNCVDLTGKVPEGVRIDPDITEGHPGYEESGDSEISPLERLVQGAGPGQQNKP